MSPEEKARQLIDAMGISTSYGINYTGEDDIPFYKNQYAKQCAIICCDEILEEIGIEYASRLAYWNKVKEAIKLIN